MLVGGIRSDQVAERIVVEGLADLYRLKQALYPRAGSDKPLALFEAKESEHEISPAGRYFSQTLSLLYYQIVRDLEKPEAFPGNCFLIPASSFLMLTG